MIDSTAPDGLLLGFGFPEWFRVPVVVLLDSAALEWLLLVCQASDAARSEQIRF